MNVNERIARIATILGVVTIAGGGLVVAALGEWDAEPASRLALGGVAALLVLAGAWPRGPGSGAAGAGLVLVAGELGGVLT